MLVQIRRVFAEMVTYIVIPRTLTFVLDYRGCFQHKNLMYDNVVILVRFEISELHMCQTREQHTHTHTHRLTNTHNLLGSFAVC